MPAKLDDLQLHAISLSQGAVLETGCVYVVPLLESLALPDDLCAATNPKSSTGRLDVFTRVIADGVSAFDQIPPGYRGPALRRDLPADLLRRGAQGLAPVADPLPLRRAEAQAGAGYPAVGRSRRRRGRLVGYRAKRHTGLVDVDAVGACAMLDYWEPIYVRDKKRLILDPDQFYILASKEAVQVPPDQAAEMVPFNPLVGEFRVHYAGFFDPGFGHAEAGGTGSRAVLEVRSHKVPFVLEDGQTIGRLVYEKLTDPPELCTAATSPRTTRPRA